MIESGIAHSPDEFDCVCKKDGEKDSGQQSRKNAHGDLQDPGCDVMRHDTKPDSVQLPKRTSAPQECEKDMRYEEEREV